MKEKKFLTINEIKQKSVSKIAKDNSIYIDEFGNVHDIDEDIKLAEEHVTKMQINVNFRWNKDEVERAKKIAEKKGLKYQSYIKSVLKQQMDKDEKEWAS